MPSRANILHLDTRELPWEIEAELRTVAEPTHGSVLVCHSREAVEAAGPANGIDYLIEAPLANHAEAEQAILDGLAGFAGSVDGVIAWTERSVELAARMAVRLGLPGTRPEAALRVRNKAKNREALRSVPGANPRHAVIRSRGDFDAAIVTVGTPCLLKPAGSAGGRGHFRIPIPEAADAAYQGFREYIDHNEKYPFYLDTAVLEEIVRGSEHSVSGVTVNGETVIFAICDKRLDRSIPISYENAVPSRLPAPTQDRMVEMSRQAVRAVGIDCCGFHVDFMVTPDGPRILEVGGRLGGEFINSHLIPAALGGVSPYRGLLDVARGRNPFPRDDYRREAVRRAGFRMILPPGPGVVTKLDGLEQAATAPGVTNFHQTHSRGDEIHLPSDQERAYDIAYFLAETPLEQDIQAAMDAVAGMVTAEVAGSVGAV